MSIVAFSLTICESAVAFSLVSSVSIVAFCVVIFVLLVSFDYCYICVTNGIHHMTEAVNC